jgi:hypothetical protein
MNGNGSLHRFYVSGEQSIEKRIKGKGKAQEFSR